MLRLGLKRTKTCILLRIQQNTDLQGGNICHTPFIPLLELVGIAPQLFSPFFPLHVLSYNKSPHVRCEVSQYVLRTYCQPSLSARVLAHQYSSVLVFMSLVIVTLATGFHLSW